MRATSPNLVRTVILITILLFAVYLLRLVLLPFIGAAAVAVVAEPLIRLLVRRMRMPRWLAAILVFIVFLLLLAALTWGIVVYAVPEAQTSAEQAPKALEGMAKQVFGGHAIHLFGRSITAADVSKLVQDGIQNFLNPAAALGFARAGAEAGMGIILGIILVFYFFMDGPRLVRGAIWMTPPGHRGAAEALADRMLPLLWRYFAGVAVVILYASALTWIVGRWFLGIHHAALFAVTVGVLEFIPVLGPVLSAILIGAVAVSRGSAGLLIGFGIYAFALRVSIDEFLGPLVLGKAVSLPAPMVIFAMLAGGAIWGILGVFIAVPATAVIRVALELAYEENPAPRVIQEEKSPEETPRPGPES